MDNSPPKVDLNPEFSRSRFYIPLKKTSNDVTPGFQDAKNERSNNTVMYLHKTAPNLDFRGVTLMFNKFLGLL